MAYNQKYENNDINIRTVQYDNNILYSGDGNNITELTEITAAFATNVDLAAFQAVFSSSMFITALSSSMSL